MNVVIPYHAADSHMALNLIRWAAELGGTKKHRCYLVADNGMPEDEVLEIAKAARCFKTVRQLRTPYRIKGTKDGECKWPMGANWTFYNVALWMAMSESDPWLWLEPDCVPLKGGWLEELEAEFEQAGSLFMGHVVKTGKPNLPAQYMNGTAVYAARVAKYYHAGLSAFLRGSMVAFDMEASPVIIPKIHKTDKIHHVMRFEGDPDITFGEAKPGWKQMKLEDIPESAVLFHQSKDGTLIDLLREKATLAHV